MVYYKKTWQCHKNFQEETMKQNRILSFVLALVMTVGTLIAGASVSAEESLYKDV